MDKMQHEDRVLQLLTREMLKSMQYIAGNFLRIHFAAK
jgi:hypothetical protein